MKCYFSENGEPYRPGDISTHSDFLHVTSEDRKWAVGLRKAEYFFCGRWMTVTGYQKCGENSFQLVSLDVVFHKAAVPKSRD